MSMSKLRQALRYGFKIAKDAGIAWLDDRAPRIGAALAFYTALSLSPLLVILIAIAGFVYGEEAARGGLASRIEGLVGPRGAETIELVLANSQRERTGAVAIVIGAVTLLFGAMGVFGELQEAMNDVWKIQAKPRPVVWKFLRNRFLSFGMVFGVGFLLLVSLAASTALTVVGNYLTGLWPAVAGLLQVMNVVVSFALEFALFGMILKVLPDAELTWRDVGIGALVTALLFNLGKVLIVMYLGITGVGSSFGAAGSVVAFLVWIYYSTQILLFGAEVTRMVVKARGDAVTASEGSEPVPGAATPVVDDAPPTAA
jgi:membrane protein